MSGSKRVLTYPVVCLESVQLSVDHCFSNARNCARYYHTWRMARQFFLNGKMGLAR